MTIEDEPFLVLLGGKILSLPDGSIEPQCVARTRKGTRCRNPIEYGGTGFWTQMRSTAGVVTVADLSFLSPVETGRWLAQHCDTHATADVVDHLEPEWLPFDPDGVHAGQVTTLDDLVVQMERAIRDGAGPAWEKWNGPHI